MSDSSLDLFNQGWPQGAVSDHHECCAAPPASLLVLLSQGIESIYRLSDVSRHDRLAACLHLDVDAPRRCDELDILVALDYHGSHADLS